MNDTDGLQTPVRAVSGNRYCRIFAAYEDFECGTVAKETCSGLAQSVVGDVECDWNLWRFDILGSNRLAFQEAVRANVLIVSINGRRVVPKGVRIWLESVVPTKPAEATALVGLLRGPAEDKLRMPPYQYLETVADRNHLAFFAQTFDLPTKGPDVVEKRAQPRVQDLLRRTLYSSRTVRGWGINE